MSVNKVIILGRVGKIDTRHSQSGDPIVSMSVATSEKWKDKSGKKQEKTEWHNVSVFNSPAKFASQYIGTGDLVYLEGKITTEKYTDKKTGEDKYATKIIASEIQSVVKKSNEEPNQHQKAKANGYQSEAKSINLNDIDENGNMPDLDDDIPF